MFAQTVPTLDFRTKETLLISLIALLLLVIVILGGVISKLYLDNKNLNKEIKSVYVKTTEDLKEAMTETSVKKEVNDNLINALNLISEKLKLILDGR